MPGASHYEAIGMSLFGEPLSTFLPGVGIILVLLVMGWGLHRARQASPSAGKVRARGWVFNDTTDFEGPLVPGLAHAASVDRSTGLPQPPPGGVFKFSAQSGLPWAERHLVQGDTTLASWTFRALHVRGHHPEADARLRWQGPDDLPAWRASLARLADPQLHDDQLSIRVDAHMLLVRVDGVEVADTEAAIACVDACLAMLLIR